VSKPVKKIGAKTFRGILAQPYDEPDKLIVAIRTYRVPEPVKKAIYQAMHEYVAQQRWERLVALAELYRVDLQGRNSILELLFQLAADFVPGFRPNHDLRNARRVGRPRHKNDELNFELFKSVQEIMNRRGITTLSACAVLSKDRKKAWHGKTPNALYEQYKRFKARQEILLKELDNNPFYARITEIKRSRSPAT
jgi:hypothetical protein